MDTNEKTARKKLPAFYRGGLWHFGMRVAGMIPLRVAKKIAMMLAGFYWRFQRPRCEVVVQNFLPVFAGDKLAAEKAARAAHRNFAAKLIDLWRVESGEVVRNWLTTDGELEIIHAARRRGRGTLFITLHLGNWEHGGLLAQSTRHPADDSHAGRTRRRPDRNAQGGAGALRRGHA